MADKTIGDLTEALQITNEDLFVLQQGGTAKKLKGATLLDFVTLSVVSVTVTTLPAGSSATATYDTSTNTLALGIPQGQKGDTGDTGPQGKQGTQGPKGSPGADAPTITNITIRQSDYHLIVTLSDGTSYDAGYCRGASGAGTGDMLSSVYDPNNKHQDNFAYVDNAINDVKVTTDATPTQGSTNPVQSGGVYSALTAVEVKMRKVTLTVAGWNSSTKQQVAAVSGVLDDGTKQRVICSPVDESYESAWNSCYVQCVGHGADSLTFQCDEIPTAAVEVFVSIQPVNFAS